MNREGVIFLVGVSSAILGAIIAWIFLSARAASVAERLRSTTADHRSFSDELKSLRAEADRLNIPHTQPATRFTAERDAQVLIKQPFKPLSADALSRDKASFLELARETFSTLQQRSIGDLETRQQAINGMAEPRRQSLEQVDAKIAAIENARKEAYGTLSEQLRSLNTAQVLLQTEASRPTYRVVESCRLWLAPESV